ncbi:MAG: ankyrin repeat protein [Rickettsiales bacterium]|jgi:ankyrin repeat protein
MGRESGESGEGYASSYEYSEEENEAEDLNESEPLLCGAALIGGIENFQSLLDEGCNVLDVNKKNQTPLRIALLAGHVDICELLAKKMDEDLVADIIDEKEDGMKPLERCKLNNEISAFSYKNVNMAWWLLKNNAVFHENDRGKKPLEIIHNKLGENSCKKLLSQTYGLIIDDLQKKFQEEFDEKNIPIYESLIESRLVNIQDLFFDAVSDGNLRMCQFFFAKGVDINGYNKTESLSSLHLAAKSGNIEVGKWLIENGASVHATDKFRQTPLHLAVLESKSVFAALLLEKGANVDARKLGEKTSLHLISSTDPSIRIETRNNLARLLLVNKANVNARDGSFQTPLHLSVLNLNPELANLLLNNNAHVDDKVEGGKTSLHIVSLMDSSPKTVEKRKTLTELLLAKKADINATDDNLRKPIHNAAEKGCFNICEVLFKNGANIDTKDNSGRIPLDIATDNSVKDFLTKAQETAFLLALSFPRKLTPGTNPTTSRNPLAKLPSDLGQIVANNLFKEKKDNVH